MPSKERMLSERQVDLSNRIFALETWEMIGKDVRDALLERLWDNLERLDLEITQFERLRKG